MNKYFTYQFDTNSFKGYRLLTEKSNFAYFKNLEYVGFKIIFSSSEIIHFEIDTQLIRKLKLRKLADEINLNSKEYYLLELLNKSKEKCDSEPFPYESYGSYWYSYSDWAYSDSKSNVDILEKTERKQKAKYRSQILNQKAKQYENKSRFRK